MRIALFEPDIPQNAAALIRLAACLDVPIDIIEPCGFVFSDAGFRRAGLDYVEHAQIFRHSSFDAFRDALQGRLILLTTHAELAHTAFAFVPSDTLLLGRESAGVPAFVHAAADQRLRIPLKKGMRSLNVAQAGAMALGEALRQVNAFPG
jgi:tRNA (cytidine/uridine-2'-O-)-methyltransferase